MVESLSMSQAKNVIVAVNGKIENLETLRQAGAKEGTDGVWTFPDESKVRTQWVTGLNLPSTYHVEEIFNQASNSARSHT